jgi:hypothetical protein
MSPMTMTWYQAAFDPSDRTGKPWVVMQMTCRHGEPVVGHFVSGWPTQHEAEGHANKHWKNLRQ